MMRHVRADRNRSDADARHSARYTRLAILLGSRARDTTHPGSDIDVGIVPRDQELGLTAELELQARLERACGRPVDLVRLDRASTALRWQAVIASVPLFEISPGESSRFAAAAALEHADLITRLIRSVAVRSRSAGRTGHEPARRNPGGGEVVKATPAAT
jgi:predicted nucleotidyltransferase